jgi:hypothetical protein
MLEALCAKRVTGVFASHLHMLHSLPLDATGVALWRMEVTGASQGEAGRYPLQRECAHTYPSWLRTPTSCRVASAALPHRGCSACCYARTPRCARHAVHARRAVQARGDLISHPNGTRAGFGRSPIKPTWRVQSGVCLNSLALEVALDCRAPLPVMRRAAGLAMRIRQCVTTRA